MKYLLILIALFAIAGCDYAVYGQVSIAFGAGFVHVQSSGWHSETTSTSLTVTALVQEEGDAEVLSGQWLLVDAPPGATPLLSNPYSPTTLITFPGSGVYDFEYHVDWRHDGGIHHSVAPVQFVVLPSGIG